ncbi:hypothetical protein RCO48_31670 [Peribacillus frigoritolerans]|nr:hypothetical protein [Peribacillus frigoritolerans]
MNLITNDEKNQITDNIGEYEKKGIEEADFMLIFLTAEKVIYMSLAMLYL